MSDIAECKFFKQTLNKAMVLRMFYEEGIREWKMDKILVPQLALWLSEK